MHVQAVNYSHTCCPPILNVKTTLSTSHGCSRSIYQAHWWVGAKATVYRAERESLFSNPGNIFPIAFNFQSGVSTRGMLESIYRQTFITCINSSEREFERQNR